MLKLPPGYNILLPLPDIQGVFQGYNVSCPGCGETHFIRTVPAPSLMTDGKPYPTWKFDENLWAPTFYPSIKAWTGEEKAPDWCCHFFLENGFFRFMGDCTHEIAGIPVFPAISYKYG